jgi:pimeloyl-ACP methyl ester carboxylesterase
MNSEELQLLPVSDVNGTEITIACRFRKPGRNKPIFVWFCGFKSEMSSVKAEALSAWSKDHGAGCLRFDYSGHGRSGGRIEEGTISGWTAQAAKIVDVAAPFAPLVFVGSSMGAWIAMLLALRVASEEAIGRADIAGMALIAPAWDMTRLIWERAPQEARTAIGRDGVYYRPSNYGDGPYAITKTLLDDGEKHLFGQGPVPLNVAVRIVHGCRDLDVPWRHSLALMDVLECSDVRLTLVKDGEHRLSRPQDLALLFTILREFL